MQKETLGFQTEVKQLLQLMIHSLYSNKEIFLRELISNASDAVDKLRFEALSKPELLAGDSDLKIRISFDKAARTLTISDNGIGMNREEVINNIGTIARSGTKQFLENLSGDAKKDANLIGQFGVGFYSSFIVADRVTLSTRRADAQEGVRWESSGEGDYTIESIDKATRGTDIVLHLRQDEDELLSDWRLKQIIQKYSDHIALPIEMWQAPKDDAETKENTENANLSAGTWQSVNQASALWARPRNEIDDAQYQEFYKHIAHDYQNPLAWTHARVEGRQEYIQLLYIPAKAPFDLWERERHQGIKLYVRRVFIMEDTEKLMPHYLRFVRGVIDSADLPLNVSRELLQSSKDIDAMRAGSVKKVLSLLEDLASKEPEKYQTFWNEFGAVLKEGLGEDFSNRDKIAKLLRFASTHHEHSDQIVSFADYVARMKEGQNTIYYITAETAAAARHSPHLEIFNKKGVEVLLLSDRVDEWMLNYLQEFEGKKLASVTKGALDLDALEDEAEKEEQKKVEENLKPLVERVQKALGEQVKEVRLTHRLTDSPSCLVVADEHGMSAHLARLLKQAGQNVPTSKPVLELNPTHALVLRLDQEQSETRFADLAQLLLDQALLAEGGQLDDPAQFVKRMNQLLLSA